jgi:hypothetical protein
MGGPADESNVPRATNERTNRIRTAGGRMRVLVLFSLPFLIPNFAARLPALMKWDGKAIFSSFGVSGRVTRETGTRVRWSGCYFQVAPPTLTALLDAIPTCSRHIGQPNRRQCRECATPNNNWGAGRRADAVEPLGTAVFLGPCKNNRIVVYTYSLGLVRRGCTCFFLDWFWSWCVCFCIAIITSSLLLLRRLAWPKPNPNSSLTQTEPCRSEPYSPP